jgi:hypothetical protein
MWHKLSLYFFTFKKLFSSFTIPFLLLLGMEYTLLVFADEFTPTILAQIFHLSDIDLTQSVNTPGRLSCRIPLDAQVATLRLFHTIRLTQTSSTGSRTLFEGFVSAIESDASYLTLSATETMGLFAYINIPGFTSYTSVSLATILSSLLSAYNTRSGTATWTLDTSIVTLITKEYNAGETYADIFTDLATQAGCQWTASGGVVRVASLVGADRTTGPLFAEAVLNTSAPDENTIVQLQVSQSTLPLNALTGQDNYGYVRENSATSIVTYGRREAYRRFRGGFLSSAVSAWLGTVQEPIRQYRISIDPTKLDVSP